MEDDQPKLQKMDEDTAHVDKTQYQQQIQQTFKKMCDDAEFDGKC